MNAAAYARVSTDKQDLEVQFDEIRQFADRRGWIVVTTDSDVASGTREDRVGFRRLLAAAARGKFDAIVVQRFDRAARSVKQLIETLEYLRRCRVHFVSIKEDVDTSTPAGELIFHVMAAIGQFERALIADRIRSGLQRAKALGKPLGRPRTSVNSEQVLALRAKGLSYRAIGHQLHISPALAHRLAGAMSSAERAGRSKTSDVRLETAPGISLPQGGFSVQSWPAGRRRRQKLMNGAMCNFCDRPFRNAQAVRAHLKGCDAYKASKQLPTPPVPRQDAEPQAPIADNRLTGPRPARRRTPEGVRARRQVQPIEAEEVQELEEQEAAHQRAAAQEAERERLARQRDELARQREQEREAARLRAQQEAEARARREAAERRAKEQRRSTIQRVKNHVIGWGLSAGHAIPSEAQAHALAEIEKELSRLAVDELPESELVTIAEGIRDRICEPVIRALERAQEDEERKQKQARRRTDLIASGVAYASQELRREQGLDSWTRLTIEQKVQRTLEQELDGTESEAEMRALVDQVLDQELEDAEEKRREKARPRLIAHGAAYAARELAREKDLDASERWRIEGAVKRELEQEITGEESQSDVEAVVDEILDDELGEVEEDDEGP